MNESMHMRILVLNYEFPPLGGGGAPVSKELAIRVKKRGHSVDVVTMGYHGLPSYEQIEGVGVYRVKCIRKNKSSCNPIEQFSYIISAKKFICHLLEEKKYDLCHVHFVVPTGVVAYMIKKKFGLDYIITAHGSDVEGHNRKKSNRIMHRLLRPLWKRIAGNAVQVIGPSEHLIRLMEKSLPRDYLVIPNGVDLDCFKQISADHKEHSILYAGRLQKSKNVQTVIKALAQTDMRGWRFDIVGDGPYRENLEVLVRELGLGNAVRFHGWIDNGTEELMDYYRKAALFVSQSRFESFGLAVVEAIASGCAVLISDIDSHRNFVDCEECLTSPMDVDELSRKIGLFLAGEKSYHVDRKMIEKYEWSDVSERYEDVYAEICKRTAV